MTRPRLTSECILHNTDTPACPHCGGEMHGSTLTLEALLSAWPPPARIETGPDGYAHGYQRIVVHCGWCARPSAMAVDERRVKLVAMRTQADDRLLGAVE